MVPRKTASSSAMPADASAGVDQPVDSRAPVGENTPGQAKGAAGASASAGAPASAPASATEAAVESAGAVVPDVSYEEPEQVEEQFAEEVDELEQARAEAAEMRDRFVRLQAEWDNFRKRTALEREQERVRAAERLVERLLPIVDDLERAIEHSVSAQESSLREGIAAVYSKLCEVLEREGVKTINPIGEPFDANLHQAVGKQDDASVPDETVTQVYQKGYGMGDRVLRPAMVVVSQGGPKREAE
jgi:molecular chaperone GrpE